EIPRYGACSERVIALDRDDVRGIKRLIARTGDRHPHIMRGLDAPSLQVEGEPLLYKPDDVVALRGLVARARMSDVAEIGGDRIKRIDPLQREQHPLRLGKRKEVVGQALHLEYRHAPAHRVVPERLLLEPDRAIVCRALADLLVNRMALVRLHGVDPRIRGDQVAETDSVV